MKTTLEKNVAIALMMGATTEQWYPPNKDYNSTGVYLSFPKEYYPDNKRYHGDFALKFHSDANWQDDVISFLEKKYDFSIISGPHFSNDFKSLSGEHWCEVSPRGNNELVHTYRQPLKKLAIFEALYEISQKLVKNEIL
jgi:hypothetical protein